MVDYIFLLLWVFQAKHYLCDYPLQGQYMLGKFSDKWNVWIPALTAHCAVHAAVTALIVGAFTMAVYGFPIPYAMLALAAFDFVCHFVMDRIKASPNLLGVYKPHQPQFWWALGFDQGVHHLTHYVIIWALVR